jgi:diacylglycerol kinase (ATP)
MNYLNYGHTVDSSWYIIINPVAGGRKAMKSWKQLENHLILNNIRFKAQLTRQPGDARKLAILASKANSSNVIVIGGDGTLNEVVNGLMGLSVRDRSSIRLTILPAGSGNDFARHFEIPLAINPWLTFLQNARIAALDVGMITSPDTMPVYFLNEAGIGLESTVVLKLTAKAAMKQGKMMYLFQAVKALLHSSVIWIRDDSTPAPYRAWNVTLANCRYLGGGFRLCPTASPFDGRLTVTKINEVSPWQLIFNIRQFFNGRIHQLQYTSHLQTSRLFVEPLGDSVVLIQADGEIRGRLPATFSVKPEAINFYLPSKNS